MRRFSRGGLWAFSLYLYAQPGVERACLALQDDCGVDVNVLLFLLWMAQRRTAVSRRELRMLLAASEPWRVQVITPLRTLRRRLKQPVTPVDAATAHAYRERVKALELDAERLQQEALERRFAKQKDIRRTAKIARAARSNLDVYAGILGCSFPAPLTDALLEGLATIGSARSRIAPRAPS